MRTNESLAGEGVTHPPSATKKKLCDVAMSICIEKGPAGLTMRALAARLGVSPMMPYCYFQNKEEILSAVCVRALNLLARRLEESVFEPDNPAAGCEALADIYAAFVLTHARCYMSLFDFPAPRFLQLREDRQEAMRRVRAAIVERAGSMANRTGFAGDRELLGSMLWSNLHGAAILHAAGFLTREEFRQTSKESLLTLIGGS